jgi:hypothetical protein
LSLCINKPTQASAILQLLTCLAAIVSATPQALVVFSHAALFLSAFLSPLVTASTKGFPSNLPGLTLATFRKYLSHLVDAVKGHLDQMHACRTIQTCLTAAGLQPKLQQLDNEASLALKDYMTGNVTK